MSVRVTSAPTFDATNPGSEVPAPSCKTYRRIRNECKIYYTIDMNWEFLVIELRLFSGLDQTGHWLRTFRVAQDEEYLNNFATREPCPLLPHVLCQNDTAWPDKHAVVLFDIL